MPAHKCSYFMCSNTSDTKSMFRFPIKEPNRLNVWLTNCGNMTITHLPPQYLWSRYLCIDHFDSKYIRNNTNKRKRLQRQAVPKHYQGSDSEADHSSTPSPGSPELKVLKPQRVYKYGRLCEEVNEKNYSSTPKRRKITKSNESSSADNSSDSTDSNESGGDNGSDADDHSSDSTDSDREDSHKEPLPDPRCSLCSKEITGFVFVCVQCHVRLCGACDARGHHATHYVLRVPIGRPEKELRAVVDHVCEAIESAGLALNKEAENSESHQEDTNEEETVFKTEIKEEVDVDEEDPLGSPEYDECPPAAPSASGSQVVPEPEELKPEPSGTSRQSGSPASAASSRRQSPASDSDDLQPLAKKRRTSRSVTIPIHTTKDTKAIDKRISTSDPIADAGSPTGVVTRIRLKKE